MAVLTAIQLAELRQKMSNLFPAVNYNKATINAGLQAIEDWFEANKAAGSTALDTATAPYVFTAAKKKTLFAIWLLQKYGREIV